MLMQVLWFKVVVQSQFGSLIGAETCVINHERGSLVASQLKSPPSRNWSVFSYKLSLWTISPSCRCRRSSLFSRCDKCTLHKFKDPWRIGTVAKRAMRSPSTSSVGRSIIMLLVGNFLVKIASPDVLITSMPLTNRFFFAGRCCFAIKI